MKAAQFYIVTIVALLCLCLAIVVTAMKENAAAKRLLLTQQQATIVRGNNAQQSFTRLVRELAPHARSNEKIAALLKSHNITVTAPAEATAPAASTTPTTP